MKGSHQRFLKKSSNQLKIGDIIPNITLGNSHLHDFITEYLLVVLISLDCEPCIEALEELDNFIKQKDNINIVMLVDGEENAIQVLKSEFPKNINIYRYSKKDMSKVLGSVFTPWIYSINKDGQVITSYGCGEEFYLLSLRPFQHLEGV